MRDVESTKQEHDHVCFRCGGAIEVGEKMVTLSVTVEIPIGDDVVEVLEANAISTLCPACASTTDSLRQHPGRPSYAVTLTNRWRRKSVWCLWNSSCCQAQDGSCCLVFDQSGLYVTCDGEFRNCSIDRPLVRREDIKKLGMARFREKVLEAIR